MIRASNIVLIYFIIGAVMFGGGAVSWDNSGLTKFFIHQSAGNVGPSQQTQTKLTGVSGAITSLVGSFGGPAILVWNLFAGLVAYLNWPLFMFMDSNAPLTVTILLGGTPTVAFYMAAIRLVKSSA